MPSFKFRVSSFTPHFRTLALSNFRTSPTIPYHLRGISNNDTIRRDTLCNQGPGTYHTTLANSDTLQNNGPRTNKHIILDHDCLRDSTATQSSFLWINRVIFALSIRVIVNQPLLPTNSQILNAYFGRSIARFVYTPFSRLPRTISRFNSRLLRQSFVLRPPVRMVTKHLWT